MLITPAYVEEQHKLHEDPCYGAGSHRYADLLRYLMISQSCDSILDYGAGKGTLAAAMLKKGIIVNEYDPGVPGKEQGPQPSDMVACIDVMEHIEPPCLEFVMRDLAHLTLKRLFVDVATKFDKGRTLSDGRNAHMQANDGEWWTDEFKKYGFKVQQTWQTGKRAWIAMLVPPKC